MGATTYQARIGETVAIDPAAGPWTILTPVNPFHTARFAVKTFNDSSLLYTMNPGSLSIESVLTGEIVAGQLMDQSVSTGITVWEYRSSTSTWRIVGAHATRPYGEIYTWDDTNGWQPLGGTQQLLVAVSPSGLAAKVTNPLKFDSQMTAEIILPGNNTDVVYNWTPTISAGTDLSFPVYDSLSSSRSGTFLKTSSGVYIWEAAAPADTWDLNTTDTDGVGSSDREQLMVGVSLL